MTKEIYNKEVLKLFKKKYSTTMQFLASLIWNISEYLKIPLGRFAPNVFGLMIGSKGKIIKDISNKK